MKRQLLKVAYNLLKVYWFVFRPKVRGALLMLRYQNQILLVRHTYGKNLWRLPGGGVKSNESPIDAIKRESWEELKIKVEDPNQIGSKLYTDHYKHDTVTFFQTRVDSSDFKSDPGEIKEAAWFEIGKLPQPLSKSAWDALRMLDPEADLEK